MADTARYNAAAALPRQTVTEIPRPGRQRSRSSRARRVGPSRSNGRTCPATGSASAGSSIAAASAAARLTTLDARLDLTAASPAAMAAIGWRRAPRGLLGRLVLAGGFLRRRERMFRGSRPQADRFAPASRRCRSPHRAGTVAGPRRAQRLDGSAPAARRRPLRPWRWPSACAAEVAEGLEVDVERAPAARAGPPLGACPSATRSRHASRRPASACWSCAGTCSARAAAAPRPRRHARPTADGRPLRHLQHRLRPRFLAQRRADLPPGAGIRPIEGGRVLPARADEHAAHLGPRHARARRGAARRVRPAARPLSAAHARDRARGRRSSMRAARSRPSSSLDDAVVAGRPSASPDSVTLRNDSAQPPHLRHRGAALGRGRAHGRPVDDAAGVPRPVLRPRCCGPATRSAIGRVTLLFSDLKGSTALYERGRRRGRLPAGARAFRLSRRHRPRARRGDRQDDRRRGDGGVPRAGAGPAGRASRCRSASPTFNADEAGADGAQARACTTGPCIAVNAQRPPRLFRRTVNLAARLQGRAAAATSWSRRPGRPAGRQRRDRQPPAAHWRTAQLRGLAEPVAVRAPDGRRPALTEAGRCAS